MTPKTHKDYMLYAVVENCETCEKLSNIATYLIKYDTFVAIAEKRGLSHYFFSSESYNSEKTVIVWGLNSVYNRTKDYLRPALTAFFDELLDCGGLYTDEWMKKYHAHDTDCTIDDILTEQNWMKNGGNIGRAFEMLVKKAFDKPATVSGSGVPDLVIKRKAWEIKTNGGTEIVK